MYSSNFEKLEIVFFYRPEDINIQPLDLAKSGLSIRTTDISNEFSTTRTHNEKIKVYVITPNQFLENMFRIKKYFNKVNTNVVYGFVLIDDIKTPSTVLMNKKIDKFKNKYKIFSDIKFPYTKSQVINELLNSVQHIYLLSNKELFQELISLREIESQAINEISRTLITGHETSSDNLIQLILKKSIEISSSDAGFVILNDELFSHQNNIQQNNGKNSQKFSARAKILHNQNI
ncbi:MAG: hypothetical protein V4591_00935, partial [Bdellovibrionota bacterium]